MSELHFKGKEFVYNHHLSVPFRPLVMDSGKGIGEPSLAGNLIIHGDNLHALKALLPLYAGKVDCVFIDPPYNTGNERWCYNDNVNAPMIKEWLDSNPVGVEDGLRHDKWCAMMWPRLRLLHELLSDRGTIWMTLDANEVHHATLILSEVFGDEQSLGILVWEKSDSPRMDADTFSSSHDFILVFAKNVDEMIFQRIAPEDESTPDHYNLRDERGRSYYLKPLRAMGGQGDTREARPNLYFALAAPDGSEIYPKRQDGSDGAWRWSSDKCAQESERIEWRNGKNGWTPYFRIYADTSSGRPPETIWYHRDVGSSRRAKAQIKRVFGSAAFDTPKPVGLVRRVLEVATERDSIVLDSFAGSGTTAHAVLEANRRDGGNRKFVLVEMEDYADDLTAERVRRVIGGYAFAGTRKKELLREKITWSKLRNCRKITQAVEAIGNLHGHEYDRIRRQVKDGELVVTGETAVAERKEGVGGSFTYCTLGDPLELDKLLTGETLPSYHGLGAALFHMATNCAFDPTSSREADCYLGDAGGRHVWLIYKPDLDWLKSPEAALTLTRARAFAATDPDARHLVFAPARYVSQKMLAEESIPVEFAPLPFALYRIDQG
ncbi:MAG: site-specific DNA-methyltransferase [Gemmatimonadota bacterium]|uniref:site-specific DNA-methyltransferase n=1 Tax=Candidatus Palauibacter scopulicola TaxID=3056741 RepID=UPI00239CEACD|nr:site-specific DNA-methyltransferase [Candidatus Palauibacter scopulicola]MDE2663771.1 site-specific DNA-methyltransferase [Candidatus Palauibacter scopulicola]